MEKDEDLENLGEKLYDVIYPKHNEMAPKLTGMLLELPTSVLLQMLHDEALLNKALEKALTALTSPDHSAREDAASTSSDSLGERLFDLVDLYNTGHTQKVTGMLLEQRKEAVLQLLSDPALLQERVQTAVSTLQLQDAEVSDSEEAEVIGETLFTVVQQSDPAHCADITGMLLELDPETLQKILSDRVMLESAIRRARRALEGANDSASHTST